MVPPLPKSNRIVPTNIDVLEDSLKKSIVVSLLFLVATVSFGQTQPAICPKHIETPEYPPLARQTRLMGEIVLSVTIDADGRVEHVTTIAENHKRQPFPLLQNSAVENMQHWTFTKPPFAPYTEVIVYDYEDDPSLPPSGGSKGLPVVTKVAFDLPDRVRILMNGPIVNTVKSKSRP